MRIALNIETVGACRGGAEKYAGTLARALAAAGHEVHVFARQVDAGELPPGAVFHRVQPRPLAGLRVLKAYEFGRASRELLKREPLDLVVGFAKVWHQDIYMAVGGSHPATLVCNSRRLRNPLLRAGWWLTKCLSPTQWIFRLIAQWQFQGSRRPQIIACSQMVAEHFRRYHGTPPEQISVVYNGLDTARTLSPAEAAAARAAFRRQHGLAEGDVAVLFAAHNYPLKGLEPLLESFAQVVPRFANARLVVCGGRRDTAYRRQAQRLGLANQVRFLGFVDDVRPCFAGCDAFAFPTFYDPCSLVVLEAMAAGLPVITTRQNGAAELLDDGVNGFVIDSPWDCAAMADRLALLLGDEGLRRQIAQRARAKAPGLSMEIRLQELLTVLDRAAAGSVVPRQRKVA